jgi:5-methylcytosine-specific restriction endonuclease McrA
VDKSSISSWARQARHRAKKQELHSDLNIDEILEVCESYDGKCAYCRENDAETLDHAFPLKDLAPNVTANVLPACKDCKSAKKSNDLVWLFNKKKITNNNYLKLIKEMVIRTGGDLLKNHIKSATGYLE